MVKTCKICSLSGGIAVQADSLLDEGRPLREISRLLSLAGTRATFMAVARHKKHYNPDVPINLRLYEQERNRLIQEFQKKMADHEAYLRWKRLHYR